MSESPSDELLATAHDDGELGPTLDLQPKLGRYLLLDRLGAGAMGTVFLAHDPELERKVAIKLLRGGASERAQLRIQREAQAMAQLTHANVVAIYDVGRFGKEVFLAMEHLSGGTLAQWLRAEPRGWSAILDRFIAAGRGLEAAHALDLIHRDFKPANVLLSADGTPKVTDFGLVRSTRAPEPLAEPTDHEAAPPRDTDSASPSPSLSASSSLGSSSVLDIELTVRGSSVGTPAYMAPEQFSTGREVDARSDQFSFCVALHEALWGQAPFAGGSFEARKHNVLSDTRVPRPKGHAVPQWLIPVIDRGLAPAPEQRWPSMSELLAALADDPAQRRRKRRRLAIVTGLALALVAGLLTQRGVQETRCTRAASTATQLWEASAPTLSEAMEASGSSYARANIERVHTSAADWALRWGTARSEACHTTRSDPDMTARQRCLAEQAQAFSGLLEVLEAGASEAGAAAHAITAIAALPAPAACSEPSYARAHGESCTPALSHAMHRVRALESTGRYREGLDAVEQLRSDPALPACPRMGDELLVLASRLALAMGSAPRAQLAAQLRRAFQQASAREDLDIARAAALAMFELERDASALAAAQTWLEIVELLDENLRAGPEAVAETRVARVELAAKQQERSAAREQLQELETLLLDTLGATHPSYLRYLVAAAALERGEPAHALLLRAQDMAAQLYGPAHPRALDIALDLLVHEPDLERRLARSRALAREFESAYGANHEASLAALDHVGVALLLLRRYEDAVPLYADLVARHASRTPLAALSYARASTHYGISLRRTHELAPAEAALLRSVELIEEHAPPNSRLLGPALINLANVLEQRGRIHEAVALLHRAEKFEGEGHVLLDNRGMLELQIGNHGEALRDIRRAAKLLRSQRDPQDLAHIDVLTDLARAELANGMLPEARARFSALLERCESHAAPDNLECAFTRGIVAQFMLEHPASPEPQARIAELQEAAALALRGRDHLTADRVPIDAINIAFVHARILDESGARAEARRAVQALLPRLEPLLPDRRALELRAQLDAWLAS